MVTPTGFGAPVANTSTPPIAEGKRGVKQTEELNFTCIHINFLIDNSWLGIASLQMHPTNI